MKPMPATITNRTMNSFRPTRTRFTRSDSLMPTVTSTPRTITRIRAGTSTTPPELSAGGRTRPIFPRNTDR